MSKTILVTGTSSGFGKLTAITLAKEGHSVIAGMRGVNGKNAEVANELNELPNIEVVELDVTSEESVNAAVQQTLKKYGQIDVLVNNAGVAGFGVFEGTSVDQMKNLFEVNLFGIVRTYQAVLPSMRKHKAGLIINVSSTFGLFATPFVVPYQMTKFGVEALTEGVRHEVKQYGIETVALSPGPFPTEIGSKVGFGADKAEIVEAYGPEVQKSFEQFGGIMYGKIGEYKADPQEVADGVLALINMKPGTRPFQTVVNRPGEGVEQEFADARLSYKTKMMETMGWGNF
jgi:NAD(P)-dependent dehydrogenase (short-subunit alcohol dehydrogenase family)